MARLGITVQAAGTTSLIRTLRTHAFDVVLLAWKGSAFPYTGSAPIYATKGDSNFDAYSDPRVDAALRAAAHELDPARAARDLDTADSIITDDAVTLPLYAEPSFLACSGDLVNVRANGTSATATYNIQDWGRRHP